MRFGQLTWAVALCLCLGATGVGAEVFELQKLKVDVPAGWAKMPSASPRSMRLKGPDGSIEVTVVVHNHGASSDGEIEQLAKRMSEAESQAFERVAKEDGSAVTHQSARVHKSSGLWLVISARGTSKGVEVFGVTSFEAGRAISVGAESSSQKQPALESAVRLIQSRIGT